MKKSRKVPEAEMPDSGLPGVCLVVAAFNEEQVIEAKIRNCLQLDYPREKLDLLFITDGSTDRTPEIIGAYAGIRLLHHPERKGKSDALNRAVSQNQREILVFSDANTLCNAGAIREMVKHYQLPGVGAVAGEKKVISKRSGLPAEGLYWKYESWLKKLDSALYTTVGAAGELFSLRKDLYKSLPDGTILEDFVLSIGVCLQGYVVRYEPGAYAMEEPSPALSDEMERKTRISAGAFQAMGLLKGAFNIFRRPLFTFQLVSHRILRWTICPPGIIVLFISNLWLALATHILFYQSFMILQAGCYSLALAGWLLGGKIIRYRIVLVPFYFAFMNLAVIRGFWRYIRQSQSPVWVRVPRSTR